MSRRGIHSLLPLLLLLAAIDSRADFRELRAIPEDPDLAKALEAISREAFAAFPDLQPGHLSMTVVEMSDPASMRRASFDAAVTYHPASVVKMFYLASAYHEAASGTIEMDEPLEAAIRDMIVDSGNDATSYVVDVITGTTSGPELTGDAFGSFVFRRNRPNRWLGQMGYDINANGKTWCEGVYGREKQILGHDREYRNRVTSDAVAALTLWIARKRAVSETASEAMLALMHRDLTAEGDRGQVDGFGGQTLPAGSKLWSKAGWTSEVRHDAMIVELPDRKYVAAILTRGAADNLELLPFISEKIVGLFQAGRVAAPPAASGRAVRGFPALEQPRRLPPDTHTTAGGPSTPCPSR